MFMDIEVKSTISDFAFLLMSQLDRRAKNEYTKCISTYTSVISPRKNF